MHSFLLTGTVVCFWQSVMNDQLFAEPIVIKFTKCNVCNVMLYSLISCPNHFATKQNRGVEDAMSYLELTKYNNIINILGVYRQKQVEMLKKE